MGNTTNIEVHLISPPEIPTIWARILPFLQQCADSSIEVDSPSEYYHSLVSGFTGLFVVTEEEELLGVFLIQKVTYPHLDICHVKALAGKEVGRWLANANDAVYNWATTHDCQQVQAYGRPGWKKFYRDQGWNMERVIYTKAISQNLH